MAKDVRVKITCDIGGKVVNATEHDLEDGEEFDAPAGWLEVVVRRVVPNEDYVEAKAITDARRAAAVAQVLAANPAVDRAALAADAEASIPDPDLPGFVLDERVYHVAPENAGKVWKLLGGEP